MDQPRWWSTNIGDRISWCSIYRCDTVSTTPGADDNASAVAMLIEVARMLQGVACQRTLRFVAFACEEPPHFHTDSMGSQVYARQCRVGGERIIGMICLEMVGYYRTEPNSQQIPPSIPRFLRWAFPHRGDFLAAVGTSAPGDSVGRFVAASNEPPASGCIPFRFPRLSGKSGCPTTVPFGIRVIQR